MTILNQSIGFIGVGFIGVEFKRKEPRYAI